MASTDKGMKPRVSTADESGLRGRKETLSPDEIDPRWPWIQAGGEHDHDVSSFQMFDPGLMYAQFKRHSSKIELFGVSFSVIVVLPAIAHPAVLVYTIPNGGTSAMVWGWAACAILGMSIAFAMAGGLYYWTFVFSSPRWRYLLSWIVGYENMLGLITGVASVDWDLAIQIMAVNLYIVLNLLICIAVIVAVPAATPRQFKNSASYALGGFANFNGLSNGYAFVLSFLAPVWANGIYDSSIHISEEVNNSRPAVLFSIISSAAIAGIIGWAINLVLAFNMGSDLEDILSNPIGQPLATVFFNSFGKGGTLALWSLLIIVQFVMGSSSPLLGRHLPFHEMAASRYRGISIASIRIQRRPSRAFGMAAAVALFLGLLAFAGPAAISAVFSLAIAAQNVAYSIPIAARFLCKDTFAPGPFFLGKLSFPVALVAVLWMAFMMIVSPFPTAPRPDPTPMNYTVVVFGGTLMLALLYYYFPVYGGVYWFKGPHSNLEASDSIRKEDSAEGGGEEGSLKKCLEKVQDNVKAVSET